RDSQNSITQFELRLNALLRVVKSTFFDVENCLAYIFVKMLAVPLYDFTKIKSLIIRSLLL
ncbi:hypothetical protein U2H24_23280, partial [Bacillus cereus]|uniref:hypothetical protein n=1 Tax=Bacillus cereus TaxID=1396 RepID=UPI002ADEB45A